MGTANEQNILEGLPSFLEGSAVIQIKESPIETGLIARQGKRHFVTSVDGISPQDSVTLLDGEPSTCGIAHELLKTFTTSETIAAAEQAAGDDKIWKCIFGDKIFKRVIHTTGYSSQVLHHAMILDILLVGLLHEHTVAAFKPRDNIFKAQYSSSIR